ncbi:MAG: hypothetical protein L0Z50_40990 [Verrucomicrobiales bacterium]|nr:hypothetical protein [Verrucomicrobiales bacterium]
MAIDCSQFHLVNVIDTCAIWNVLSSQRLISAAKAAKCHFSATTFVYYEALHKPRTAATKEDVELQKCLQKEREAGLFGNCSLDISDLQEIDILERRIRVGKGELSSIAFAKKAGLAFMTDDQKARKLGSGVIGSSRVQTTPHLCGWLFFIGKLSDSDKSIVIHEHERYGGPLRTHFETMYNEALRCRLMAIRGGPKSGIAGPA